jgi:hypothetical protein
MPSSNISDSYDFYVVLEYVIMLFGIGCSDQSLHNAFLPAGLLTRPSHKLKSFVEALKVTRRGTRYRYE